MARTGNGAPSPHLRTAVLVVIVGIWAASVVAQMFSPAYNPTGINELMTAVVMYLLAKHQNGGRSEAPDDEDQ